jgi:hypothetical protein
MTLSIKGLIMTLSIKNSEGMYACQILVIVMLSAVMLNVIQAIFIFSVKAPRSQEGPYVWCHDVQYKSTQHNDTQHKRPNCDIQHKNTLKLLMQKF